MVYRLALIAAVLVLWLASGLLVPASLARLSAQLQGLVTIFLGIFIEALPFLVAGVLASSAIHLFVSIDVIQRLSPRSPILAALSGSLLGLAFPVCECGSVPTARRLLAKGAPLPLGIAFVLAAPVVNPVVIASTWVAFSGRPELVFSRIGLTVLVAAAVGLALGLRFRPADLLTSPDQRHNHDHAHHDHDHTHEHAGTGRLRALVLHSSSEFFEMSQYLAIGALIAATLQMVVPRETLLALGEGPVISALLLMALAFVLSICSTVDAFVALAFVNLFPPGAILAFLVFGPMVDIKSILMFTSVFRRAALIRMVLLIGLLVLAAASGIDWFYGR
jgi:uncharacterized membrane protein YraQ (UPF0718 family)